MQSVADKSRENLIKAIRAFTVDRPNDEPNNNRERCLVALGDALDEGNVRAARTAHDNMCEASADMLRDLRVAADAYFGEDFKRERRVNGLACDCRGTCACHASPEREAACVDDDRSGCGTSPADRSLEHDEASEDASEHLEHEVSL